MAQAERVGTGEDRSYGALLHSHAGADRLHLERIGHDGAREAELDAEQVVQDLSAHGRGRLTDRADDDVRGHDRLHVSLDRGTERDERVLLEAVDDRQREVGVDGRVAVTGKVLRARGDTGALQPAHERRDMSRHQLGVRSEGADPDDRIQRIRVDVRDRREVEVHADVGELGADRSGDALGQLEIVDDPQRGVPRI